MPLESLLFLTAFIPLRSYVGGFHASNHFKCYWISTLAVITVLAAVRLILNVYNAALLMTIGLLCAGIMFFLVPVPDANRPLEEIEVRVYGRRARVILCIEILVMAVLSALDIKSVVTIVFCTICLAFLSTCAGVVKNHIKPVK
jgi:accessory gene regulator B